MDIFKSINVNLKKRIGEKEGEQLMIRMLISVLISPFVSFPEGFGVLDKGLIIPTSVRKTLVYISHFIDTLAKKQNTKNKHLNNQIEEKFGKEINEHFLVFFNKILKCEDTYLSKRFSQSYLLELEQEFHRTISLNLTKIQNLLNIFFKNEVIIILI